jgi:hypothetical protein
MMFKNFILALIFLNAVNAMAQAPKYSNEFLSIGVGARALGMGGAQVATVSDATSAVWNPAGLPSIKSDVEVAAMHSEYFAGIAKYDYGTIVAKPDASRAVAFSVIRFGVDNIPDTSELIDASGNIDYSRLKSFSAADYAFLFSYALRNKKVAGLQYGGSAKIIHRKVGDFAQAWGFGLDAGAQYDKGNWIFGAMAKDITSTFNAWSFSLSDDFKNVLAVTGNEIPENSLEITLPKLILGAGYKTNISSRFTWLGEANADMTFDGQRNVVMSGKAISADPHLGVEFGYDDFIFLRGGLNNIQYAKDLDGKKSLIFQPNFGIGLRLKNLSIDYALTNIGSQETLYSNVFSLKLDIYKHVKKDAKPY